MLYLIGLGLSDETDITVKGLEIVRKAARVYLENYTAILLVETKVLEEYYGRPVIVADREMVESDSDSILKGAETEDVAFLVVGDPYGPNASIMSAIGAAGLQLYNYGQTVSMVFFTDSWKPTSFYDRVKENRTIGLHTLVLLDIKVKEQSLENMARGRLIYEPPRYMTVGQCAEQMLESEEIRGENAGTLKELAEGADEVLGGPLHSLVLLGRRTHELEHVFVREFALDKGRWDEVWKRDYEGRT
ncbi:hypothetical protein VE04_06994 [Pseudogymnoascus sp. 24MN13]|nr:hypothetical protein VE04_06994 [Pseudogymnoascus sp. 24MN13]